MEVLTPAQELAVYRAFGLHGREEPQGDFRFGFEHWGLRPRRALPFAFVGFISKFQLEARRNQCLYSLGLAWKDVEGVPV